MALSRIWSAFIIIAILVSLIKFGTSSHYDSIFSDLVTGKSGDTIKIAQVPLSSFTNGSIMNDLAQEKYTKVDGIHYQMTDSVTVQKFRVASANGIIATCNDAVELCLKMIGIMALFMGFMAIAEKAGGINLLSRIIQPLFSKLFPEIPKGHPAFGHMMMNFSANLLGLDNAATPFGLKAMSSLQEINPNKETASNAQIMFLCMHASGLTLIPVSIIALRASAKSASPTDIFLPCMIATFIATCAAIIIVGIRQKINLLQPIIVGTIAGVGGLLFALVSYLKSLDKESLDNFSKLLSNGLLLFIFLAIIFGALYKKINIFDAFVEGAKGGFETCVKIIPYLVGMLVAISMLRNSGVFDVLINGMKYVVTALGGDIRFVDGLPTALIKPLSGSGARGMMVDTMKVHGADSLAGRLACILQGSSDTTMYVLAVYFGSVNIKNIRYSLGAMLLADLVGIISAVVLTYLFFA